MISRIITTSARVASFDGAYLARLQRTRSQRLINHARVASPFFRRLLRTYPDSIEEWSSIPPTRKSDLMADFDDWVADPRLRMDRIEEEFLRHPELVGRRYLNRYHIFTTSGTTGTPAVLVHDPSSWTVFQLISRLRSELQILRNGALKGMVEQGFRSAVLFATGGHFGGVSVAAFTQSIHPLLSRRVRIVSVLLPIGEQVRELNDFQPTFLSGYPSAMVELAGEKQRGRLTINPALILCAGEHLSEAQRTQLEQTFSCHVIQGYAASEVPGLALECDHHRFHVNADWYLIEPIDSQGNLITAGTRSDSCLVTNLSNFVQPIIRYDLGDRVLMHTDSCACGSRLPTIEIEGRTNDLVTLEGAGGTSVTVTPLALGTVIEETPGVQRFQVLNPDRHHLIVRFDEIPAADREETWDRLRSRVSDYLARQGASDFHLSIGPERPQPDSTGGKLRQVLGH